MALSFSNTMLCSSIVLPSSWSAETSILEPERKFYAMQSLINQSAL